MAFEYGNLTDEEIRLLAKATGMSVNAVKKAQEVYLSGMMLSLNQPVGTPEGELESELGDFIEDTTSPSPYEVAIRNSQKDEVRKLLRKCLKPREEVVIVMLYGLEDGIHKTLDAVGKEFRVTRERIRQVESKALRKIRRYCEIHGYKSDSWFMG